MLPKLVLLLNEPIKESLEAVKDADVKCGVAAFCELDVAPLEEYVKDLFKDFRLSLDEAYDLLSDLDVLVKVLREHLFQDFVPKDLFALHFYPVDLVGFQLLVHPFHLRILLSSFFFGTRVHLKCILFDGGFRLQRGACSCWLGLELTLRQIKVALGWRCLDLSLYFLLLFCLRRHSLLWTSRWFGLGLWGSLLLFLLLDSAA